MNKSYPYWRVIILTTFVPFIAAFLVAIKGQYILYFLEGTRQIDGIIDFFIIMLGVPFGFGVYLQLFFFTPAFLASIIYATLRLHKTWTSFLIIGFVSFSATYLWYYSLPGTENGSIKYKVYLYATFSSLIMAYFALPKRNIK